MVRIARAVVDDDPEVLIGRHADNPHWIRATTLVPEVKTFRDALDRRAELADLHAQAIDRGADGLVDVPADAFLSPVDVAGKILAIGFNYKDHLEETGVDAPEEPFVFVKSANALNGPFSDINVQARLNKNRDYESELAVIIGETCKDVSRDDALNYVAGYAVANDFSSREWQIKTHLLQWLRAKGMDGFCPLGPWVTTSDEVDPTAGLPIQSYVNGELRQNSSTSYLLFNVAYLVSFVSQGVTLNPGDIILTGSPSGVIYGMKGQPWLQDSDVVTCRIEGLGEIRNKVVVTADPSA